MIYKVYQDVSRFQSQLQSPDVRGTLKQLVTKRGSAVASLEAVQ